jgi:hypothetical protein
MSPSCYADIYARDPLEEGEIDVRETMPQIGHISSVVFALANNKNPFN